MLCYTYIIIYNPTITLQTQKPLELLYIFTQKFNCKSKDQQERIWDVTGLDRSLLQCSEDSMILNKIIGGYVNEAEVSKFWTDNNYLLRKSLKTHMIIIWCKIPVLSMYFQSAIRSELLNISTELLVWTSHLLLY